MKGLHLIRYDLGFPDEYRFAYDERAPKLGQTWEDRVAMVLVSELEARLAAEARMDEIEASR